jgi:hypothetical protein
MRPHGRPSTWKDNIKMDLKEITWAFVDSILLVYGRDQWRDLLKTVTKIRVL